MAASPLKIANSALVKIGCELITSLSDDNKRARIANEQYEKLRDEVLAAHPWNFCVARKEFAVTADTPAWGYNYEYTIPTDCLRVLEIDDDVPWAVEINPVSGAKVLVTDASEVLAKYIRKTTDTTLFSAYFDEVLATRMAADMAYALVQSTSLAQSMMDVYMKMLAQARSFDGQEGTPPELEADDWLNSRY
jgi:hypothetical protein